MKRKLQERFARIETEARKLARSGQHRWSHSIEMALLARGYRDAPNVFANCWTQYELDRLREQAIYTLGGAAAA
jgi:hypothetical protein